MKIKVNNIELNYVKEGNGRPVILLHGNGEDHHIFDELIIKLKEHFTIYAIDSRNHGESSKTNDYAYETMAEDIYQLIKKLDLTDVSLVGFSDGAILGVLLSIEHPLLFSKMALLGINLKPTDFKEDIYNYLAEEYQKTNDPLLKMMLEQPNIELSQLGKIKTASLVVAGEDDLFYEKSFEDIAKTLTNAKLKIMTGHDHGSYIINQDMLYPDLIDFLL